jgi:hypothetical protein
VRRGTGESYREFLTHLAKASGIEPLTLSDLKRIDKESYNRKLCLGKEGKVRKGFWPGQLRPKWTLSWPHMRSYGMSMAAG